MKKPAIFLGLAAIAAAGFTVAVAKKTNGNGKNRNLARKSEEKPQLDWGEAPANTDFSFALRSEAPHA